MPGFTFRRFENSRNVEVPLTSTITISRSRRWGDYWLELLGDSGFVPEDRLAAVKKETGELKGIFVSIVVNTKAKSKNPKL